MTAPTRAYRFKTLGRSVAYSLTQESVIVETTRLFDRHRVELPLDQIPKRSTVITSSSPLWFWMMIGSGAVGLFLLVDLLGGGSSDIFAPVVVFGIAAGAGVVWARSRRAHEVFHLINGGQLSVEMPRHPWGEASNFIAQLHSAKVEALQRKVGLFARDSEPAEVTRYIVWLRDAGLLGDDDFQRVRDSLDGWLPRRGSAGFDH